MSNIYKAASSEPGVVYSVTGENGVTASPTTGNVVVSGVNATTSAVGVASFNSADFTVSMAGEVSLVGSGGAPIQTITGNSGSAEVPDSSGNFNILGSGSITVAGTTNTETISLTGLTDHAVLVGAGTATITKVGPTVTAGQVLQSQGSSTDPAFSTATYPSTTTINQILYSSSANTVGGLTTANNGVLITGTTGTPSVLANSATPGYVLTANSAAPPSWQATAQTVTSVATAHSTAQFVLSGTTETVDFGITNLLIGSAGPSITSAIQNVGLGYLALNALSSGSGQVGIGYNSLLESTGSLNTATGGNTLSTLLSGASNTVYGYSAGSAYTGSESSNILIKNAGSLGESNVIRIGTQGTSAGQQNICYIAGIHGASPVSGNTPQVVVCDSNGNLTPISSSTSGYVLTSNGSGTPSFQAGGGGNTASFSVYLSANHDDVTGDTTQYTIAYDTKIFDLANGSSVNNFNTSTHTYTFPYTGQYQINVSSFVYTDIAGIATAPQILQYAYINATTYYRITDANCLSLGLTANGEFITSSSFMYNATANDTMQVIIDCGNGLKNIGVAGGADNGCFFSGFLI
jgi:hypothetical protein